MKLSCLFWSCPLFQRTSYQTFKQCGTYCSFVPWIFQQNVKAWSERVAMPAGEIWGSKSLKSSTFEKVFLKVKKKKNRKKKAWSKHHLWPSLVDSEGPTSPPKVAFFKGIAKTLDSVLILHQTNKPMVPFLAESLDTLLGSLCVKFIRKDKLENGKIASLVIKVDIADKANQNNISSVDLGSGIKYKLKRLIYSKKVTSMQVFQFKKEASPCSYPMEKNQLHSLSARCRKCLSPNLMVEWWNPQDLASWCLRKFCESLPLINSCQVGKLMQQTMSFQYSSQVQWKRTRIPLWNMTKNLIALILFFGSFSVIPINLLLQNMHEKLMILSHYQVTVEMGFSVNVKLLVEKPLHGKFNCSETYPRSHAELWFTGSWFGYYKWIIGLCQFCKKRLFSEPEREIFGRGKVF